MKLVIFYSMMMMTNSKKIPLDGVSLMIFIAGGLLGRTWRYSFPGGSLKELQCTAQPARIFCLWHAHLLPLSFMMRNIGINVIVSASKDGVRAASVLSRWGYGIIQGSSSHGGMAAVRAGVKALREGRELAITPDGPRGPRCIAKPGAAQIALLSGAPIIPIAAVPRSAWYLNSWDRFMIPKPFTRVAIHWSNPIFPSSDTFSGDAVRVLTDRIQETINACG